MNKSRFLDFSTAMKCICEPFQCLLQTEITKFNVPTMSYTLTSKIPTLPIIYSNPEKGPPLKRSLPVVFPGHSCCLRSLLSSIKYIHIIVESLEITWRFTLFTNLFSIVSCYQCLLRRSMVGISASHAGNCRRVRIPR